MPAQGELWDAGAPPRALARAPEHRAPAAALAAIGAVALAYASYRVRDRYVGDAAIYASYARNAAHLHLFQFNVGEFSSGSTSPLWALLLAFPFAFGGGLAALHAFAGALTVAAFLAVIAAARYVTGSWTAAAVGSLFALGTMALFAITWYESALLVAVGMAALAAGAHALRRWEADGELSSRAAAPLAVAWGALPLARPDALVLVVAQAVALVFAAPAPVRRAAVRLLAVLAVAAIPAVAYYGYSLVELGTPSVSSQGRSFALREVAYPFFGPFYKSRAALDALTSTPWIFGLVPAVAGLTLVWRARRDWLATYAALALGGYLVLLTFVAPGLRDTPRYLIPLVPMVVVGVASLLARAHGTRLWWPLVVAGALAIGVSGTDALRDHVNVVRSFPITEREVFERDVTAHVNRLARPSDTLLAWEVQLRYFLRSDVRVLSEDGVTDGKVHPYQVSHDMTGFLRRYRPRWWIADENVNIRRFVKGSVLQRALLAFRADPRVRTRVIDGIRFELVARRTRPIVRGFGGWQLLLRLDYPPRT